MKGCAQRKGLDFEETFSPVVRYSSIRYLLALAAQLDLNISQMDAVSAFLQGELAEEIYMYQPEGYEESNKVCKLRKSIYGLKQASRVWNTKLDEKLREIGLTQSKYDSCVYYKTTQRSMLIIAICVDDFLIFSNDKKLESQVKSELKKHFSMTDIGEAKFVLGFQIIRDRKNKKIWINQKSYLEQILKRFNMQECNPISVPMNPNERLSKKPRTKNKRRDCKDEKRSIPGSGRKSVICFTSDQT